MFIVIMPDNIK
jgi:hypothetical protein